MSKNENLIKAKQVKNDEFYTRYEDIERELADYRDCLKGKWVYCNCDTIKSNFWNFFYDHYSELGLLHLTITGNDGRRVDYDGFEVVEMKCEGDEKYGAGDFRSEYCQKILRNNTVVITNPPFSLFREFMDLLFKYENKFLVIGSLSAVSYKNVFPYMKDNSVCLGNKVKKFFGIDGNIKNFGNIYWFTNILKKKHKPIELKKKFNLEEYPKYNNLNGIEVGKIKDIPLDYEGIMGVPITFFEKWSQEQFDVVSCRYGDDGKLVNFNLNGKKVVPYNRVFIKRVGG